MLKGRRIYKSSHHIVICNSATGHIELSIEPFPQRSSRMSICAICRTIGFHLLQFFSSLLDGVGQCFEDDFGVIPSYACICDGDTIFEAGFAFGRDLLVACKSKK